MVHGEDNKNTNINDGDPYNLFEGEKQGFLATDGSNTTIIFYSTVHDGEGAVSKDIERAYRESLNQIEEVANIRFFDADNLTRKDVKYLNEAGINLPSHKVSVTPHLRLREENLSDVNYGTLGEADSPEKGQTADIYIEDSLTPNVENAYIQTNRVVLHEVLHSLGLEHLKLPFNVDNTDNSVMSYNGIARDGGLKVLDVYSLIETYGINPDFQFEFDKNELVVIDDFIFQTNDIIENSKNISREERELYENAQESGISNNELIKLGRVLEFNDVTKQDIDVVLDDELNKAASLENLIEKYKKLDHEYWKQSNGDEKGIKRD